MTNIANKKTEPLYFFIIILLIILNILAFIGNTYGLLFYFYFILKITPFYGLWFKEILGNIAIILLLSFKKFRPLGLIITLATTSHLWFLYKTTSVNPLTWFEKGYILVGISILAQFIAIIAAFIGLLCWWKLRKPQK